MRRLLVFCAVAGALLAAYAVAQNSAGAQSGSGTATAAGLMANARVVANGVAARALAVDPGAASNSNAAAASDGNSAGVLELTVADSPNRVFAVAIPAITSLPAVTSKRGPSTACAGVFANGANTKSVKPAHSAQDDGRTGCAASSMAVVAGVGRAGSLGDGGAAVSAQLDLAADSVVQRSGIAVGADGTIFIADTQNSTIRSVGAAASSEPGVIRSVAGRWAARQNIALGQPMGIAVDRAGNLYIADYSGGAVDVLSATTGQLATLAQVISPASIAVTPDGSEVFVASPSSGAVFAISASTGSISAVSGFAPAATANSSSAGPCANVGSTAQAAAASQPVCPAGLAADGRGDLFVADASGGKIIRVDAKTKKSNAIASGLSVPGAIALDAKGDLFVAEQGASRVIVLPDVTANSGNITLTAPAVFAAPCPQTTNPFTYCNMPSGGTSPTAVFTLTNTSSTQITGITITPAVPSTPPKTPAPPPTDFTVESTSCTTTLPANGTCLINVAFTPQGSGARSETLSVTDSNSGDSATYDLAGTGDDYSLQLAGGQAEEVNVAQGGTTTFKAMVVPDSVFGQNGEMVKFQCPSNLPLFATCSFSPCPVAITPGTAVAFSVMFVTSSATSAAPTVGSCGGSSGVGPGVTRNPTMILRAGPERRAVAVPVRPQFPSPWWLALGAIALAIFVSGALVIGGGGGIEEAPGRAGRMGRITPSKFAGHSMLCPYEATAGGAAASRMWRVRGARTGKPMRQTAGACSGTPHEAPVWARWMGRITPSKVAGHSMLCPYEATRRGVAVRVRYIFAVAGFAVALMIGCGGKKAAPPPTTPVTPVGVTSMTILGNATDASGNALGTSRSLQVTLDVVAK